jgi:hypothetical protein
MGELVGGQWRPNGFATEIIGGAFRRKPSVFRNWLTVDGSAPEGARGFKAVPRVDSTQCGHRPKRRQSSDKGWRRISALQSTTISAFTLFAALAMSAATASGVET